MGAQHEFGYRHDAAAGTGASDRLPRNWLSPVRDTIAITGRI